MFSQNFPSVFTQTAWLRYEDAPEKSALDKLLEKFAGVSHCESWLLFLLRENIATSRTTFQMLHQHHVLCKMPLWVRIGNHYHLHLQNVRSIIRLFDLFAGTLLVWRRMLWPEIYSILILTVFTVRWKCNATLRSATSP